MEVHTPGIFGLQLTADSRSQADTVAQPNRRNCGAWQACSCSKLCMQSQAKGIRHPSKLSAENVELILGELCNNTNEAAMAGEIERTSRSHPLQQQCLFPQQMFFGTSELHHLVTVIPDFPHEHCHQHIKNDSFQQSDPQAQLCQGQHVQAPICPEV